MLEDLHFEGLTDLSEYVTSLVVKNVKGELKEKPPLAYDDVQDQIRSATEVMQLYESFKQRGDYWPALRYLVEDLRYYNFLGDTGKSGHILIEIADCLFSCGEVTLSSSCCSEAISLLVGENSGYDWAREIAATGELLLVAVSANALGYKEAKQKLREVDARLSPKERRALAAEDAHRVARRMIAAYREKSGEQLQRLSEISPRRRRTEGKNLLSLLLEWMEHYDAIRSAAERISPEINKRSSKSET